MDIHGWTNGLPDGYVIEGLHGDDPGELKLVLWRPGAPDPRGVASETLRFSWSHPDEGGNLRAVLGRLVEAAKTYAAVEEICLAIRNEQRQSTTS